MYIIYAKLTIIARLLRIVVVAIVVVTVVVTTSSSSCCCSSRVVSGDRKIISPDYVYIYIFNN